MTVSDVFFKFIDSKKFSKKILTRNTILNLSSTSSSESWNAGAHTKFKGSGTNNGEDSYK